MDSKKRRLHTKQQWKYTFFFFFFSFFILVFLFHGHFSVGSKAYHPVLTVHPLSLISYQNSRSEMLFQLKVVDRILFPDHVLLLVSKDDHSYLLGVDCIYRILDELSNASDEELALPVLSMDEYNDLESIIRCPLPPGNYSAIVNLRKRAKRSVGEDTRSLLVDRAVHSWESLVYGAVLDGETAVVFVKGLNLRADRVSDASQFSCHFEWDSAERSTKYVLATRAITAAQEVVRCLLPRSLRMLPARATGARVTIGVPSHRHILTRSQSHRRVGLRGSSKFSSRRLPSVAKLIHSNSRGTNSKKHELCVCTMVWNQASSLREWIAYHAWLGVERWFIYDNNSEDNIKEVVKELEQENYNVSRHVWPWIKTQEAGFSHCALEAKNECKWVGFIDVDEYFYFPVPTTHRHPTEELGYPGRNSLRMMVAKYSNSTTIGEIRTTCHSFGPSGLTRMPSRGVTVGYTCRLQSPERHKSIIRPDALDDTLLTVVHHFHLKPGYKYFNLHQSTAVINHYKYQVWESFKAKFSRRVATYVADWQENQNEGSKDRAPGLGTEAIEPPNWSRRFCEVWDTGLRDFIMSNLANQDSGLLPWERSLV